MKNNIFNWSEYYKNHYNSKPSHTLIKGLTYYNKNKLKLISLIKKKFNSNIIVRSSTIFEDGKKKSFAGHFKSIQNINVKDTTSLINSINAVIKSYKKFSNPKNEILIQEMIKNSEMSGVITTSDLKYNAPYYIVNYSKGSDTTSVTSGGKNTENFIHFKKSKFRPKNYIYNKIIKLAEELEKKFNNPNLDIEFAVKKKEIYLFQVRSIINKNKSTHKKENFIRVLTEAKMDESPSVAPNGNMVIYGIKEGDLSMLAGFSLSGARFKLPASNGEVREPAWSNFLR